MNSKKRKEKISISFFCPAFNDEKNLPIIIPKVFKLLKKEASRFEIVIIDDASPDNSGKIADELAKKYKPFIKVIHHKKNRDYGGALRSGFEKANKYDYVFYTDGDNQYDVTELENMIKFVPMYDAVIGYRRKRSISKTRLIQSNVYNFLIHSLYGVEAKDVGCALRLIKKSYIKKIPFYSTSAFVQVEVLLGLKMQNAKIKEIPAYHHIRKYGQASGGKPKVILHTLSDMIFYKTRKKQ
jgi:glycosyltransferase involved in cell wall biosynthesis